MKMLHLIPLLVATAALAAPTAPGVLPDNPTPSSTDRTPPPAVSVRPVEDPALLLPPVLVIGSAQFANRQVQPVAVKDQPFTLLDGGYYWKHAHPRVVFELKLQYHPGLPGYDLASVAW
jgi:hypothetical protein